MRCIFSMLFGASAVIFIDRLERRGAGISAADLYYRRTMWLILIGMLHAYFIWAGDILYAYGVVGLLLFPLRRLSARALIIAASVIIVIHSVMGVGGGFAMTEMKETAERAEQAQSTTPEDLQARAQWAQLLQMFDPPADTVQQEIATHRGGWVGNLVLRAREAALLEFTLFFQFMLLDVLGMLVMGMGLMKAGVFDASRSNGFYAALAVAGFAIGVPLNYWAASQWVASGFQLPVYFTYVGSTADIGRFSVALGYTGLIMLACRAGVRFLVAPLAAVGRLALSNYLMTSIVCTVLFNGYGFGLFGSLSRAQLLYVVVAVWAVNLVWSPIWLRHYMYGPAEWAWRSLTYWRRQPMRRVAPAPAPALVLGSGR
jgi:uncharacterized protein